MKLLTTICSVGIMAVFGLSGCASSAYFYDQVGAQEKANEVNIYVDHLGNIYPTTGVSEGAPPRRKNSVSVRRHILSEFCDDPLKGSDVSHACDAKDDSAWRAFQNELWRKKSEDIFLKANSRSGIRPIVFLVHGFNNLPKQAKKSYNLAHQKVTEVASVGSDPFFVNIYWDGFFAKRSGLAALGIIDAWWKAQGSGPLVGFNMRILLNTLDDNYSKHGIVEPPIRVITHSSGAFVIAATIGDTSTALKTMWAESPKEEYRFYKSHAKDMDGPYRVPDYEDFRIAMYAAATPSNTFTGKFCPKAKSLKSCKTTQDNLAKAHLTLPLGTLNPNVDILIAYNPNDIGPTKARLISTKSSFGGASGLGGDKDLICDLINAQKAKVHPYDMVREEGENYTSHYFKDYLNQRKSKVFLKAFMSDGDIIRHDFAEKFCDD